MERGAIGLTTATKGPKEEKDHHEIPTT